MLHDTFANRRHYIDEPGHYGLLLIIMYYKCFNNGTCLLPDIHELVVNISRNNVMLIHATVLY